MTTPPRTEGAADRLRVEVFAALYGCPRIDQVPASYLASCVVQIDRAIATVRAHDAAHSAPQPVPVVAAGAGAGAGWVACSERLPEAETAGCSVECQLHSEDRGVFYGYMYLDPSDEVGKSFDRETRSHYVATHWAPFLAPPKADA